MKFLVLLALVGLSIAAPAVDYGGSTVKPVQGVQGQTGHVYALPAGTIPVPVTNNIQSLPNQNIPLTGNQIGQPILGQPIGQPIGQPNLLKNEGQPLDTPLLNNSQVLLPYLQQQQNFGYPWLHLQQNPHMMALYHMWLQQHQLQMFNWYNQLLFQQWMGQNHQMFNQFNQGQLPFGQFNQGSQLPIGSQIGLNQGSFGGVSLPNPDLLNGRASPILIQNPLYTLPTTTTTRLVTPFRNQNLIGTPWTYPIRTQFRVPIRHNVFPYEYGMNNGYYGQYPYGGGYNPYLYGMQGYQSYPYFGGFGGNGMGGNGIFLDNQIQNTVSNVVPTDTLTNNQPIVNQPTI